MVRVTEDEARGRLSELIRKVGERRTTILIEMDGEPRAVLISLAEYTRLRERPPGTRRPWRERIDRLQDRISEELGGNPLPPPEEVIRRMREERDEQILGSLR